MLSRQDFFTWARNGPYSECSTEQLYFAYEVYQICPLSRDPEQISHEHCSQCGNCCRRQWRIEVSADDIQRWIDEGRFDILESLERSSPGYSPAGHKLEHNTDTSLHTPKKAAADTDTCKAMALNMAQAVASGEATYVIPKTSGCKYLVEGEQTKCGIYDTRPELCRNFPSVESA